MSSVTVAHCSAFLGSIGQLEDPEGVGPSGSKSGRALSDSRMNAPALKFEPRPWQREALSAWQEAGQRGVAKVVTGGGKTVFAELCMSRVLEAQSNARIVVLVPTLFLLDQWVLSLEDEFGVDPAEVALWSGGKKPSAPRPFNVAVINTARRLIGQLAGDTPTMLVVDEVHRAASAENAKALAGNFIATLGLSATPERQFDDLFAEVIEPRIGPIIFDYDIVAATRDGILSDFEAVNVEFKLLPDEAEAYEDFTKRIARRRAMAGAEDDEILEILLRKRARVSAMASMRVPLAIRLCEQHKGARCLIFHEDIRAAQAICRNLIARNHAATMYHSKIGGPRRRDNLRMFKKGIFDVLVCCRALDEGLNIPEVEIAIIASSTSSVRQRIQRLGRVLRPHADKEKATIYTLFATPAEKDRLSEEAIALRSIAEIRWARASANYG